MAGTPMVTRESVPDCERGTFDAFVANRDEAPTTGDTGFWTSKPHSDYSTNSRGLI